MKLTKQFAVFPLLGYTTLSLMTMDALSDVDLTSDGQVKLFGDLRVRTEGDKSTPSSNEQRDRQRSRYRARLGLKFAATQDWQAVLRMASNAQSVNSANENFSTTDTDDKSFGIDLAYLAYKASQNVTIIAGKTGLPFWQSTQVWWDKDINPEGLAVNYENGGFSASGGYFKMTEGNWASDVDLLVYQGRYQGLYRGCKATFALGGAQIDNINGHHNADRYQLFNTQISGDSWLIGFEYQQSNASSQDTALVAQVRYQLNEQWAIRLYQLHVEAFAVIGDGAFSQDDFPTPGNTGVSNFKGYRLQLDYKMAKSINVDLRYFDMERLEQRQSLAMSSSNAIFDELARSRLQLNLNLKF
jgi:hypothetical protein